MPAVYGAVRRLVAVKKLLIQRGSLIAEEVIDALPQFYFDQDQNRKSALRAARRDFDNLIALGFPIARVRAAKPANYNIFYWGSAPPPSDRHPRKFKVVCDRCGAGIALLFPHGGRHLCAKCKAEIREERKTKQRLAARQRYRAKKSRLARN